MIQLVVAEKPSVARDIARVLGVGRRGGGCLQSDRVWITWCVGHLAELVEPEAYNGAWKRWSMATLPMVPEAFRLRPSSHAYDQWQNVRRLLLHHAVGEVVNACDAGREGELIFRFAYELAECRKPVRRLWLSALTDGAVRSAFNNLKPSKAFDALAAAARCRAEADWLVGLNATRALTLQQRSLPASVATTSSDGKAPLFSVGRVQTPTLAMLVAREREIAAFVPKKFWQVLATFAAAAGEYEGFYQNPHPADRHWEDRLDKRDTAEAIAIAVRGQPGTITAVERREHAELPPRLFDLTDLQRRANVCYHLQAAQTLEAAQSLYEKHKLLTYPRTDSNCLTQDMAKTLPGILRGLDAPPYSTHVKPLLAVETLPLNKRIINDAEVGDHHAIIPTGKTPHLAALTPAERQVFDLVAKRFIAAFYPPARFALTRIDTKVGDHKFVTRGRVCLEKGWQAVEPPLGANRPGAQEPPLLPPATRGEPVHTTDTTLRDGETKPPPRYNDALLLSAMERAGAACGTAELRLAMKDGGLGTPATRASIIEVLQKRGYARRDGKLLVPTAQGDALIRALPVAELKSPELTGAWEARLARVAKGEMRRETFMQEVNALTRQVVTAILGDAKDPPRQPTSRKPHKRKAAKRTKSGLNARLNAQPAPDARAPAPSRSRKNTSPTSPPISRPSPATTRNTAAQSRAKSEPNITGRECAHGPVDGPREAKGSLARQTQRSGGMTAPPAKGPRAPRATSMPICPQCQKVPLMRGRAAWGCSAWAEGCPFTLSFAPMGHALTERTMKRLIEKGSTAPFDSVGAGGRVKFQFDLQAPARVRLVPARERGKKATLNASVTGTGKAKANRKFGKYATGDGK